MASVTSLPELMVGISSSAIVESADLAAGDILGSCLFNLAVLAVMDAFLPKNKPLFSHASQSHVLAAALGLILISMVGIGLFLSYLAEKNKLMSEIRKELPTYFMSKNKINYF